MSIVRFFSKPHGVGSPLNIYMFTPANLMRHMKTALTKPRYFVSRVRVMVYQQTHPGAPWLTADAIRLIKQHLKPSMMAFEWGSGGSTAWLARRVQRLVSVEHDPQWYALVNRRLQSAGLTNVEYRLEPENSPGYAGAISSFPDETFDFVLVDGSNRDACIRAAAPKLKPGGMLVLDNADHWPWDVSPCSAMQYTPTDNGVWRTDVYMKRAVTDLSTSA
jgi:predicted O-methyltransferase YrrM